MYYFKNNNRIKYIEKYDIREYTDKYNIWKNNIVNQSIEPNQTESNRLVWFGSIF